MFTHLSKSQRDLLCKPRCEVDRRKLNAESILMYVNCVLRRNDQTGMDYDVVSLSLEGRFDCKLNNRL